MFALEAVLNPLEDDVGEGAKLTPDIGARKSDHDQDRDDLGNEGEGDFLNLGERLNQSNTYTDDHGDGDGRTGGNQHRPDRILHYVERIGLVHGLTPFRSDEELF